MFPGPLRAFHESVQAGSIRKAAERLGQAPSSVSRQIIILERLMGTALFSRSSDGITLTHAGLLVAEYAQSAVMDFDSLRLDLNDLKGNRGLIRVAMVESIISGGPVTAASKFQEAFAGVSFEFQVMPATEVVEAVIAKTADVGISFCTERRAEIVHEATIIEPLMLVVHKDHPLAAAQSLSLTALASVDLALPDRKFGVRRLLDQVGQKLGVTLSPAMTTNSFEALRSYARSGRGATILPSRAVGAGVAAATLTTIPLDHPELRETTLDLIRLKAWRLPRIVRLYLEALRTNLERPVQS